MEHPEPAVALDDRDDNPAEAPPKKKTRQRLLHSLQRVSSSPALAQLGRVRSSSSPASLSCLSLASSSSPLSRRSPGSYFSHSSSGSHSSAHTSIPGSPNPDSPYPPFDGIENVLATRRADLPPGAAAASSSSAALLQSKKPVLNLWANLPHEINLYILSFLRPRELVRTSCVSKDFHRLCFDGQLWACLDASEFYKEIPAPSLAKIIISAGPFVKDLNLRGCVQVGHYGRAETVADACKNLLNATLEGCKDLRIATLHSLLKGNEKLAYLNLKGLTAVTNETCKIIAQSCQRLEVFNVSWCKHMDAVGVQYVVESCPQLRDLRAGEIRGFHNIDVAQAIFETNSLERLVLAGCEELTDHALQTMMYGTEPEFDILTDLPLAPPRKLRHLDLSRCIRLSTRGVQALGHLVPDLEGLQLTGVSTLTDAALEPILASTPRLTHLELEDLTELTNSILSEHLAKAPCAPNLEHLSVSYCENIGDPGVLPVIRNCVKLRSVEMDNTRISDLVLAEAASMVSSRAARVTTRKQRPQIGLSLVVYDCHHVSWTGVREVLSRNAQVRYTYYPRSAAERAGYYQNGASSASSSTGPAPGRRVATYPTEIIGLKCFYGWQMTVDEHTKRALRGDILAANRLERKWAEYMQAIEEAGTGGAGGRRRRRRAREAQQAHATEEDGGAGGTTVARRRARTAVCVIM